MFTAMEATYGFVEFAAGSRSRRDNSTERIAKQKTESKVIEGIKGIMPAFYAAKKEGA